MTIASINDALVAHDPPIGWAQFQSQAIFSPPTAYCNRAMCGVYADASAMAGVTDSYLAGAVAAHLNGDTLPLAEVFADGEAFATVLTSNGLAWRVDLGTATTWVRDPSVRPALQTALVFDGEQVSPGEYFAAGDAAGATATDLAVALRDLVDGDSTMFDAIMSAI